MDTAELERNWGIEVDPSLLHRAQTLAHHLSWQPDEGWRLNLPPDVAAAFSPIYGRAVYAVVETRSNALRGLWKESKK